MKDNRPKVSVIVPIYNVAAFIERCAITLFEQTLDDIEYIFINDCTPDNSIEILTSVLKRYPHRKEQVKIINQPCNLGAAKAREKGIKVASGEYIIHCDSDDWVDKDMYRQMYDKASSEKLDMLICDWFESDGAKHNVVKQDLQLDSDLLAGVLKRSISGSLCNKLVACYIYSSLDFFPTAHMMEDVGYTVQFVVKCRNIGYMDEPLYYYFNNEKSICKDPNESSCIKRCEQACENINEIISYLRDKQLEKQYTNEIVVLKNSARVFLWPLYMKNPRMYSKKWHSVYPEINWKYPFTSCIDYRLRIIFFFANIGVYPYISRFFRK